MKLAECLDIPGWGDLSKLETLTEWVIDSKAHSILDVGCYRGRSTATLALACPDSFIVAIDDYGPDALAAFSAENLQDPRLDMLETIEKVKPCTILLAPQKIQVFVAETPLRFDFVHVDSGFTTEERFEHLECIRNVLLPRAIVVIDDAHLVPVLPDGYEVLHEKDRMLLTQFGEIGK